MIDLKIIEHIANHYGFVAQKEIAVEECAEFIMAVKKLSRSNVSNIKKANDNLIEETADLCIMALQMRTLLGENNVDKIITEKLQRQLERIEGE